MIQVIDLIKGKKYINPNTGTVLTFDRFEKTKSNIFAIDSEGTTHIAQTFKSVPELRYVNGKATIREGRKTVGKIFYRPEFFKGTRMDGHFNKDLPYNLEIGRFSRECATEAEAVEYFYKFASYDQK